MTSSSKFSSGLSLQTSPQFNKAYLQIALNLNFAPADSIMSNIDLDVEQLETLKSLDVSIACQAVRNLNRLSNTPIWPAILGAHLGVNSHGPVGYATLSAPTVGKALSTFVEWEQVRSTSYTGSITEEEEHFVIVIEDTTGDKEYKEFFFETFMRAFEVLIAQLIGHSNHNATELHFITQAENREELMRHAYDSLLIFGSQKNTLRVHKSLWFTRSPLYDKESHEYNLRKCQQLSEDEDYLGRSDLKVRALISKHFDFAILSRSMPEPVPSLKDICKSQHLTERTLIRRLKAFNTSYKKILEEERIKYSEILLGNASYTIFQVAELLGYCEPANYCRAFKVWFGQSPTQYRRQPKA